jgi:hypothetical protein
MMLKLYVSTCAFYFGDKGLRAAEPTMSLHRDRTRSIQVRHLLDEAN